MNKVEQMSFFYQFIYLKKRRNKEDISIIYIYKAKQEVRVRAGKSCNKHNNKRTTKKSRGFKFFQIKIEILL